VPDQVAACYAGSAAAHPGTRRSSETAGRCAGTGGISHRNRPSCRRHRRSRHPWPDTHARKETHRCATTRWSPPW
jgi:hypothetical protein